MGLKQFEQKSSVGSELCVSPTYHQAMHEPSDTSPSPNEETGKERCENCGDVLDPMEWETLDDQPGYDASLHFCDEECLEEWKVER